MSIFVMADLHLSSSVNKPMDICGVRWTNYMEKIKKNWSAIITDDDTVIVPGDITWAIDYNEALEEFKFIEQLPGKKLLSKGNHDYWWETLTKMNTFLEANEIKSVSFMHNTAILCGDVAVCGAKGWISPEDKSFKKEDEKFYRRELIRFENVAK